MERIDPFRWAFEPALAGLFLIVWTIVSLRSSSVSALGSILLLTAAIAVSRLSPAGAVAVGALALLLQVAGFLPGAMGAAWAYVIAGMVVVFATAAYGSPVVRWLGLAAAIVLALATVLMTLGFLSYVPGAALVVIVATLLVGAWLLGATLNRRAASPELDRSAAERWLARNDLWAPDAAATDGRTVTQPSTASVTETDSEDNRATLLRQLTKPQLAVDVSIAVLFTALGLLASGLGSWAEVVVLFIFAVALAFRRAAPLIALAIVWAGAITQMALQLGVISVDVAILVVLYATAAYGGRATRWAGLVSVGVGAVVAAAYLSFFQFGPGSDDRFVDPALIAAAVPSFVTVFVASAGVLGLAWTLGFLVRTWRRARLSRSRAALAIEDQRAAERSVVVEQERNRIARDMHDVVAHSLAVVIAQADGARYAKASDPGAVDTALTTIAATAREALGDVRILLAQLRMDEAGGPQPVLADLPRLLEQLRSAGLAITWTETGAPLPLGSGGQLAVYRIVQEALTNALRHGQPDAEVIGSLAWDDAGLTVTIENVVPSDDEAEHEQAGVGHGLPGMRERALLAGGTLTVDTPPGRFRVTARVPAPASAVPVPAASTDTATDSAEGAQQ